MSVAGTAVTIEVTVHMPNGIEIPQTKSIDLASDDDFTMTFFSLHVYVIPTDLKIGDSVFLGEAIDNQTIVGEATMACAGVDRTVFYSNFSQYGSQYTFYWDKQTGVLTEATMVSSVASKTIWVTDTNMWSGGVDWWLLAIIIIIIVCVVVASVRNISQKLRKKIDVSSHS